MWICAFCSLVGFLLFTLAGDHLIGLYLHGESEVVNPALTMQFGKEYLTVMLLAIVPFCVTQIYASSLRETGESLKPMVAGLVSVAVDVVLNYLLIYGKFGFPQLGVYGAAVATVLSKIIEMLIVVIWTHRKKEQHEFVQ